MVSSQVDVPPAPDHDASSGPLQAGHLISAYRVEQLLGVGGMGWVYRARHELNARSVALKILREDQLAQDRAIDRVMREATILASIPHPGLPRFHECGVLDDGRPWIAMELVDGVALADRMKDGPLDADLVIDFMVHVADVLAAVHARDILHRDLKPDNIILAHDDPRFPVRVIDWGIALAAAGTRFTAMNEAMGTPTYMAPEQARGNKTEQRSDIYGLGVVAYQALTGRAPFVGASAVEILVQHLNRPPPALAPRCPDAPYGLVELVERMVAKDPEERPKAADITASLGKLRAARQHPTLRFAAEASHGVSAPVFEPTPIAPSTHLVPAWPDPED
ncbi:MAG TPA: serine/threonine-protein kinase [Kofleriaceae bacterium]|jgi:serine/threonine-protein kinase|nr:serine/threonine-protein kinase [Kofleriaceae bacterium]